MKHLKQGRKFGLKTGQRRSFLRILVHNLVMKGSIKTTEARAKEIRPRVEKLVTIAKKNDLAALKLLSERLPKTSAYKLYHEVAPRYQGRKGGYLRIKKVADRRKRDGVSQVVIEFV
ncbi:MAG: 50S ribosomal protein L17 [Candidatus Colwellbacteria bacterium]|nr:50S ribosomal protein L17 [Candidatus Colwellbacteria bacterium]